MFFLKRQNNKFQIAPFQTELVDLVSMGLKDEKEKFPELIKDGQGGTYLMRSKGATVAVFKPTDEEPKGTKNPKGISSSASGGGLKKGTRVGQGAFNEVAAYVLDHPMSERRGLDRDDEIGFSGVPLTIMVNCMNKNFNHPGGYHGMPSNDKLGSLQKFIQNDGDCDDDNLRSYMWKTRVAGDNIGDRVSKFYEEIPKEEVQKISVLDIRMANADRHGGNILYKKENGITRLTPIDHGYCLPESFEDCTFEWLKWKNAKEHYTPETVTYINTLNADYDIDLLKKLGWTIPDKSARTLKISTKLLQKGVEKGLTPYEIGKIMCRGDNCNIESKIEIIMREAEREMDIFVDSRLDEIMKEAKDARGKEPDMNETDFLNSDLMDSHLQKL